ncbi:serine hydrolase domain-containing protein [Xanthomonas hortorum]|uniref:serine hydrolase domain-containing protein n=1 Tax=Xanthomonas TaxID=338 RepID=UPI0020CC9504|nr:serine hydrolase domain-containing protein [Xanthomonas hortorum]UTS71820.1 beta-lactamase family protein [Xanthomonas hortorum]
MHLHAVIATALLAMAVSPQGAQAEQVDSVRSNHHDQVDAILSRWKAGETPGCAIGISVNDVLDYAKGFGSADLSSDAPITPATVFHVASISKQFTAFSIGVLEERGKLSYDDSIRRYMPELPSYADSITISDLIHHTNGLREQGQLLNLAGWRDSDVYTESDVIWALTRQQGLNFKPGTEVVYTNAAYTLLGIVVQRVSGKTLRQFAQDEIFIPLGMRDTRFSERYTEVVANKALSYVPNERAAWDFAPLTITHYGSTGLLTTVGDLLKWEQNLIDGRVGGQTLIAKMKESGELRDGTRINYGSGLRLDKYRSLNLISHDGADVGFRSDALLFPDQRLAIVALCNGATTNPASITRSIADIYLDPLNLPANLAPSVRMTPEAQSVLAGTYWSPQTDELIRIDWRDNALRPAAGSVLVPIGSDVFRPSDQPHEWTFHRPSGRVGDFRLVVRDFWPTTREFVKLTEPMPAQSDLEALTGTYQSEETDMTYTVAFVDGRLRVSWPRGYDLPLDPVGGNRFSSSRGTITFIRDSSGLVEGLTLSNRRLRRMTATRIDVARGGSKLVQGDASAQQH